MVLDPKFTAAVSSSIVTQTEENTLKVVNNSGLTFTLCDRDDIIDNKGNYFISLNLPFQESEFSTGSSLSLLRPELQQLNVDEIIIVPIPPAYYNEFIDGRTIKFSVPQKGTGAFTAQTNMSAITLVSSTYTSDKILESESDPLLGDNVVFLFSDTYNKPYTGNTLDEIGNVVSHATNTTWEPSSTNTLLRPSATSYMEVKGHLQISGVSTDLRTNAKYSVNVGTGYPDNRTGYNYDVPLGFAVLDKGVFVITHTGITSNFPWQSGYTQTNAKYVEDGLVGSKTGIYFTGVTASANSAAYAEFEDVTTSFKTTAVCIAMPRQFYISNNATWNRSLALATINQQQGIVNLDPVFITEIGMYNALGELVAVAKLSEPVEKNYINVVTFYIDIEM